MGKKLLVTCAALVAVAVMVLVVQMLAGESGEVVVLHTFNSADGAAADAQETRLWVVDHDGSQYLRAGAEMSGWYQSLLANPAVEVQRDGVSRSYTAVPAVAERARINELMQTKYGWRESYIGTMVGGREAAMPIRLDPR